MKTFIGALVTLAVLTGLVIGNTVYIQDKTADLLAACDGLPETADGDGFDDAFGKINGIWDGCRGVICLSVSHAEAEMIDEALTELDARRRAGDGAGYVSARAKLLDEIRELGRTESFSLEGIL